MKKRDKLFKELELKTLTNYLCISKSDLDELYLKFFKNKKIIQKDLCAITINKWLKNSTNVIICNSFYSSKENIFYYFYVFPNKLKEKGNYVEIIENLEENQKFITLKNKVPFIKSNKKTIRLTDGVFYTLPVDTLCLVNEKEVNSMIEYQRNLNKECFGSIRMTNQYVSI